MNASITVGNVLFPFQDLPSTLTFGGDLAQTEVALSDGSTYVAITGIKWTNLSWKATMYARTSQGTPIQRAKLMQAQFQQARPVTVHWRAPGIGVHEIVDGTILTWHWSPVRDGDVDYEIVLHRSSDGGLMAGGVPRPPSRTRRTTTALQSLQTQAATVGPKTLAAMQAARLT